MLKYLLIERNFFFYVSFLFTVTFYSLMKKIKYFLTKWRLILELPDFNSLILPFALRSMSLYTNVCVIIQGSIVTSFMRDVN